MLGGTGLRRSQRFRTYCTLSRRIVVVQCGAFGPLQSSGASQAVFLFCPSRVVATNCCYPNCAQPGLGSRWQPTLFHSAEVNRCIWFVLPRGHLR